MTNNEITYNQRQYKRIIENINSYLSNNLSFEYLIQDIEALILCLDINEEFRNTLLSEWGSLEEVYAFNLEKEVPQLDTEDKMIINKALINIQKLINNEPE